MEIPKEVMVFETYEEAKGQILQYFAANNGIISELTMRAEQYKKDHPEVMDKTTISGGMVIETGPIYPAGIGNGLEIICAVDLIAFTFGNQREFTFNIGHSAGLDANEERYHSLQDMTNAMKSWINQEAGFYGNPKITPFIYTINVHQPVKFSQDVLPSDEAVSEMRKEINNGTIPEEARPYVEGLIRMADMPRESGFTEAEREEFRKAFFGE